MPIPPETPLSLARNLAQILAVLLFVEADRPTIELPREWVVEMHGICLRVIVLLENQ